MSLIKKLVGETVIYGISSILGRVLSWVILTPYLTNAFLKEEYGIFSTLYTYIAILLVIFTYRLETAYFRFGTKNKTQAATQIPGDRYYSTAAISLLVSTGVLLSLLLLFSSSISVWLEMGTDPKYVIAFSIIVGLDALAALPFARLRLKQRPYRFAAIRILGIVLNIIIIFFFLEFCPWLIDRGWTSFEFLYQPSNRLLYLFYANIMASGLVLLLLVIEYLQIKWTFSWTLWKQMMRYAWPLVIAGLAGVTNQLIGIPLLKFLGPGDQLYNEQLAGVYSAATKLAVLMNLFIQAFNYAAEPFFFRQAGESDNRQIYADVGQAFALVSAVAFVGIMLYVDVFQFFIGADFREGLGVLPILLIANFFLGLFYNFSVAYKLTDRTLWGGYIAVGGAVITLGINIIFIPKIGYFGPAWASFFCFLVMALAAYWVSRRFFPIPYPVQRMTLYLVSALLVYVFSVIVQAFLWFDMGPKLLLNSVIFGTYLLILWITERKWIISVLRN